MTNIVKLNLDDLAALRTVDEKLVSYNIEMTEVTGRTFWKAYTDAQIAGREEFKIKAEKLSDFTVMADLMQYYPPIDLYNERLRLLAKKLGSVWVRVSGSWATKTYYDFEGTTGGKAPAGYQSVLTKEQWIGVLDCVKAVGGKLLISVSNCEGDHPNGGALDLTQTKKIFDFSHAYGVLFWYYKSIKQKSAGGGPCRFRFVIFCFTVYFLEWQPPGQPEQFPPQEQVDLPFFLFCTIV